MTRKKVTLAYIANDSARKATFKKRKKGLIKKVSELSTLCGIEACAVIYSPYDTEPEVWPSVVGARRTIARFRNMPEMDQSKRMVNQPVFLQQRIGKAEEQLQRQQRDNREKEVTQLMYQALTGLSSSLQGLSLLDLNDLGWVVEKTLREVDEKMQSVRKNPTTQQPLQIPGNISNHSAAQVPQTHLQGSTDQTSNVRNGNNSNNDHGPLQDQRVVKGIDGVLDVAAMDGVHDQPWYMELLKPSESQELMGFTRFSNSNYSSNNEMMIPNPHPTHPPPPLLPPCPSPSQNLAPWSNFFFP